MISEFCHNLSFCVNSLEFLKNGAIQHPYLGWFILFIFTLLGFLKWLSDTVPAVETLKAKIYIPLAKKRAFNKLVKSATKADIRGNVNAMVREWQKELPAGWIQEMDIQWVERESKNDFLNDDEIVLRIRPLENQELNFVSVVYHFLRKVFFPKTKQVIPETHREASVLFIARKLIESRRKSSTIIFEDEILEPAVARDGKILGAMDKYKKLDSHGLFTGVFLREIHAVATEARFKPLRNQMKKEIAEILGHIEEFIDLYEKNRNIKPTQIIPDEKWHRKGPVTDYGFLLIANPIKVPGGEGAYVRRAQKQVDAGINRLYVFGAAEEESFANNVIDSIAKQVPKYRLIERFVVSNDYRGDPSGIGALFVLR